MANFETVKAGIITLLKNKGYRASSQLIDFENASANEYGNTFILKCLTGENQENTIIDRFDDLQEWQVLIAFDRSEHSDIIQYDKVHREKDAIIKYLDNPTNWTSFVKVLKYSRWEIVETSNYYVLDIRLSIIDIYTLT